MPVSALRLLGCLAAAVPVWGHDPVTTNLTWTHEISRLVYRHCATCHRPNGAAMSLLTYPEARPWAKSIRNEVMARRMPPFDPVQGIGEFLDDPSLSQPEIDLFVAWVEGGAPEGSPAPLPTQPVITQSPPCHGSEIRVGQSTLLTNSVTICGVHPEGPLEVTAILPDSTVRRLIWIQEFHAQWNRTYKFVEPEILPKGTRVLVNSSSNAAARLLTNRQPEP